MNVVTAEHFPPQPAEIPRPSGHLDQLLIVRRQPLYGQVGELMFRVNDLLHKDGRQPGEAVFLGQEELGFTGLSGVASLDFVVADTDKGSGSIPFITRTRHMDGPNPTEPSHTVLFAEKNAKHPETKAWQAGYQLQGDHVDRGRSRLNRIRPMTLRRSRELIDYLSQAATYLESKLAS